MAQNVIFDRIREEREAQDKKWGRNFEGRPDEKWLAILMEEVGEIAKGTLEGDPDFSIEKEIVQCAAVCISWLEFRTRNDGQRGCS